MWTGFISQIWGDIQEEYHRRERHDKAYTGKRWATNLVQSFMDLSIAPMEKASAPGSQEQQAGTSPPTTPTHQGKITLQKL